MANPILQYNGTPIVFADIADDFGDSPFPGTDQLTLASLASTAAVQSDKVDLGEKRAVRFDVTHRPEFDAAPSSGNVVSLHWAPSVAAAAAVANPGGVVGAAGAYTGTAGDSLADSIAQLDLIGTLVCTSDLATVVQQQTFTYFPKCRYGTLVVWNKADQAFEGDDIEMSVIFMPVIDEVQD